MKIKIIVILSLLILTSSGLALSEDQAADPNALPVSTPGVTEAAPQENNDSANTQWVWGEVTSIDAQSKSLNLKYLDYESDQEKEMAITTDDSTSYDNAKALDEIQPKDNISVDYIVKDGKNIAKAIGLEKAESAPVATKQGGETNTIDATDAQLPQANQ